MGQQHAVEAGFMALQDPRDMVKAALLESQSPNRGMHDPRRFNAGVRHYVGTSNRLRNFRCMR